MDNYKNKIILWLCFCGWLGFSQIVSAQYAPYSLQPVEPVAASMAASGIALSNKNSALYANPSLLLHHNQNMITGGVGFSGQGGSTSAVFPYFAFYDAVDKEWGWGLRLQKDFSQNFPGNYSMGQYAAGLFVAHSYQNFAISASVGPATIFRYQSQSSYSWKFSAEMSYRLDSLLLAIGYRYPGKYRFEGYRGSDELTEVLPETLLIGLSYQFSSTSLFYGEVKRIFWERISFGLNGLEERADFERGIGAELSFSSGLQHTFASEIPLTMRGGLEMGGAYNQNGENQRSLALAIGLSLPLSQPKDPEPVQINFSILDYSLFSRKGGRQPETNFYLSILYQFGTTYHPP